MVSARKPIFCLGYFSGVFRFVIIVLTIILYCTFRRIGLLPFYIFLRAYLFPVCFQFWVGVFNLSEFRLGFICCVILYWLLFPRWFVFYSFTGL